MARIQSLGLQSPQELWKKSQQNAVPSVTPPIVNPAQSSVSQLAQPWMAADGLLTLPLARGGAATQIQFMGDATEPPPPKAEVAPAKIYQRAKNHDDKAFVPRYSLMAYHESGQYRKANDPYAVGAISNPTRAQDKGGKTYGTYQFETYVYRDGSKRSENHVENSTLMRFLKDPKNPFGADLLAIARKEGVASSAFDKAWKSLAEKQNKAFGLAQENFVEADTKKRVESFFKRANISPEMQARPEVRDIVLGTTNQFGSADKMADHLKALQKSQKRPLTVKEIGVALSDYKLARIPTLFKSSPKAWAGVRSRFNAEKAFFQKL